MALKEELRALPQPKRNTHKSFSFCCVIHQNNYLPNPSQYLLETLSDRDVTAQIALQPALKFNGGGNINHSIFWTNLSPNGGGEPQGKLMEAIKRDFGSFEKMKEKLAAVSVGVQGSGWGWLGFNKESGRLNIIACPNQDPLQGTTGLTPLLGIDVWEHAYYLQYKNVRPDYVKAIWNVVNWENVAERFQAAKK
ncbi:Superoxide dismutase [Mn], mitochondrial [Acipenser ruthenus]|uniref:Superoxide dismutase n=1 Tax=Acipenser ruthenus TaxID=7906 RepID=A0A444UIQ8_ACIRT|nr:Superoxide dismutase [Mn], mitochondrial [Acipenser ruthenus]